MEANPFPDFKISSSEFLDETEGRSVCPKCEKSRKYYCYTCYVPVKGLEEKVPKVKLPIKIDIIKHPNECDGKSTAAHAGVLAPDHVSVYTYPVIPDYTDRKRVVLVFPGENSICLEDLAKQCGKVICNTTNTELISSSTNKNGVSQEACEKEAETADQTFEKAGIVEQNVESSGQCQSDKDCAATASSNGRDPSSSEGNSRKRPGEEKNTLENWSAKKARVDECTNLPFDTVVFIDSTWNQTKKIYLDERLKGLRQVELKVQETKFWRHQQDKPKTYLATIEAIYYFLRQFHEYFMPDTYDGQYDNILFFFSFMYHKIRHLYEGGKKLKAYQGQKKNEKEASPTTEHQSSSS